MTGKLTRFIASCALVAALGSPVLAADESVSADSPISIVAVTVMPEKPAADTLCRLVVRLSNAGDQIASQLGFKVTINGTDVPVYANQLWMYPVQPGAESEIALFNFWSTETSRPMPKDGKLKVEVTLTEAQWTKIEDVDSVETWTPLGAVPGLPVSGLVTLPMAR